MSMARTTSFDELRSRRGVPQPPSPDEDPIGDMIRQQDFMRGYPVKPGYQERLGDPTKVITDVPPSLNAPMAPTMQTAQLQLPEGFELDTSGQKAPPEGRTGDRPFSGIVGAGPFGARGMPQMPTGTAQASPPPPAQGLPPASVFENMSYEQRLKVLQQLRGGR